MRPVEFTPEAIIQAGQDLQTAGRNITGFALRQKVGGGNPARLKQVWDEHQSSQTTTVAEPVAELPVAVAEVVATISKSLTERIEALAVDLNDKAVKAAALEIAEEKRKSEKVKADAVRELADAAISVEAAEDKLDEVQATAEGLQTKLTEVQTTSQAQAVELAQVRERLTVTEQTAKAATEQHAAELTRMNAAAETERNRHQKEAEGLRAEVANHKKATQAAAAELDQVRAELVTVKAKAEAADQLHQEQRTRSAEEIHRTAERMTKAEADRDEARKEASTAREDAAKLRGQVEAMQTQTASLMKAITDRQAPQAEAVKLTTKATKGKQVDRDSETPNALTAETLHKSDKGEDVFHASSSTELFKELGIDETKGKTKL